MATDSACRCLSLVSDSTGIPSDDIAGLLTAFQPRVGLPIVETVLLIANTAPDFLAVALTTIFPLFGIITKSGSSH
ncbi:hypothetical protein D3C71_1319060 [compost metagenome]